MLFSMYDVQNPNIRNGSENLIWKCMTQNSGGRGLNLFGDVGYELNMFEVQGVLLRTK